MTAPVGTHAAVAFGCRWQSDLPLTAFLPVLAHEKADITVSHRMDKPAKVTGLATPQSRVSRTAMRYTSDDMIADASRSGIDVWSGPAWARYLPPSFFGTVTAACMTWRGQVAMHGSAVAVDGEAVLVCGDSGAGKSTMTAALLVNGARLISDDLSVLSPQAGGRLPCLFAGRRTLRLFPDLAEMLVKSVPLDGPAEPMDDKMVVKPPTADPLRPIPIRMILLLDAPGAAAGDTFSLLQKHLYRPRRMQTIPGHMLRMAHLQSLAQSVPVQLHAPVAARSERELYALADATMRLIGCAASLKPCPARWMDGP